MIYTITIRDAPDSNFVLSCRNRIVQDSKLTILQEPELDMWILVAQQLIFVFTVCYGQFSVAKFADSDAHIRAVNNKIFPNDTIFT